MKSHAPSSTEQKQANFVNLTINPMGAEAVDIRKRATVRPKEGSGRGRPPTGKALSAAERQARRMAKLEA